MSPATAIPTRWRPEYWNPAQVRQRDHDAIHGYHWRALCAFYGHRCLACGRQGVRLTKDHVVPRSKGGRHHISNIQPLCYSCNQAKDNQVIDYRERRFWHEEMSAV